ncbi:hypothetical protein CHISP_2885 [Chitinispirillum alkaliphilum]|nr:hypothetical protein CHISP_2885 [Chitinispirillum alkaliphilum]
MAYYFGGGRVKHSVSICLTLLSVLYFYNPTFGNESYAHFFAGVKILKQDFSLSAEEKALKFRELEILTGVNSEKATAFLAKCVDNPSRWNEMQVLINEIIHDISNDKRNRP